MKKYATRTRTAGDYGNSPQAAALRLQLAGLATLEASVIYQEMCAAADARVRADAALPRQQNGKLLARALAASPSPGRRSAVDGRGGDAGGTQAQPFGEVGLEQAPPISEERA